MTTTLANQLPRINLANGGLLNGEPMQSAQVVTLKSGQQNASSVDSKSPMHSFELRTSSTLPRCSRVTGITGNYCRRIGVGLGVGEELSVFLAMKITNSDGCRVCGSD